jgi:protein-L-isoaspartate(D-aspartate) O-methyltransferase
MLIDSIKKKGVLRTKQVEKAFENIKRRDFVPEAYQSQAEIDIPLPIGFAQTVSQPYTVAFMLDLLQPKKGEKILDVGSGSGWTTALLTESVGRIGRVFGIEIIPELVSFGQNNLKKYGFKNASIEEAGVDLGLSREAPFDKILVSAAAKRVPDELTDQLKIGGIMVIPVGHSLVQVKKISETDTENKEFEGFVFVPLVNK